MVKYKDQDIGSKGVDPHVYAMGEGAPKLRATESIPRRWFGAAFALCLRCPSTLSALTCLNLTILYCTAAFKHVKRHKTAAALIMSGESGAGKTETTKHLMRCNPTCARAH